jgi:hypothetical protein
VADYLYQHGVGSLLLDLLTPSEEAEDQVTRALRFDIPFLAKRVVEVMDNLQTRNTTRQRSLALFGASTGAAGEYIELLLLRL